MRDRLFGLFFACTIVGAFTFGLTLGKHSHYIENYSASQVNRVTKNDQSSTTFVVKNPQ